jgi:hypothetical protein
MAPKSHSSCLGSLFRNALLMVIAVVLVSYVVITIQPALNALGDPNSELSMALNDSADPGMAIQAFSAIYQPTGSTLSDAMQRQLDDSAMADMLPTFASGSYQIVEGGNLTRFAERVTNLLETLGLPAGPPTDLLGFLNCYQDLEALSWRLYTSTQDKSLIGIVFIVNENELRNPLNLVKCGKAVFAQFASATIGGEPTPTPVPRHPCSFLYSYEHGANEYFIGYFATDEVLCTEFCSQLPGCSK